MSRLALLCLITICICAPAKNVKAQTTAPPIPNSKSAALGSFKERLDLENKKKTALQERFENINNDLSDTKTQLISIADAIQQNENDLKRAEQKIANMKLKKSILEDKLKADRASIASLILALERIRRTPPEAMIAMPETPYKTAQSAMLMGSIIPSVNRHADKLNKNLEMLNSVEKELEQDKSTLISKSKELKSSHEKLSNLLSKRKKLYMQLSDDIKTREVAIQKISLQARNLKDLVKRIDKEEKDELKRKKMARIPQKNAKTQPKQKIVDDGKTRLPISGIIRISYKEKDKLGATSKGITMEGRGGSIVVAPMNGKIKFTGSFKRYGNIVVIEHANGYHSLVAGLGEITAIVGAYIKSGEPIGILPNSSLIPRPTLYYELRRDGNPINPAVKFPDLG